MPSRNVDLNVEFLSSLNRALSDVAYLWRPFVIYQAIHDFERVLEVWGHTSRKKI